MTTRRSRPHPDVVVGQASPRTGVFLDAVAAELMKVRTLRSTYAYLAGGLAATALGALFLSLLVRSYDAAAPAEQAAFETADPTVVIMPFVAFFVGAIGATLVTGEFGTGSIGVTLLAVPRRRILMGAKATVAALVGIGCGVLFSLLTFAAWRLLYGDRPAPLNPWPRWTEAVPTALSAAVVVLVTCLVALGLGAVLRSTAAALTTLGALVLVSPVFAHFLPTVWQLRLGSVLLPNLTPQLAGGNHPYLLSQGGAAAVAAAYVVLALGAGAVGLVRRDAS